MRYIGRGWQIAFLVVAIVIVGALMAVVAGDAMVYVLIGAGALVVFGVGILLSLALVASGLNDLIGPGGSLR